MRRVLAGAFAALLVAGATQAQNSDGKPPAAGPPDWSAFKAHVDKAKAAAGTLWASEERYFCLPGQRADRPDDPAIEPVKLFDNVWAIGQTYTLAYVVRTPAGVVLIDAGRPDKLDTVTLPSLARIGVAPGEVKYVLVSQIGLDHWGGSKWFQQHGARVALSAEGWDIMASFPPAMLGQEPVRDIVAEDSKAIMIGGVAFTPVDNPGLPAGSLGWFFPVQDHGKTRMAALFVSILRADRLSPGTVKLHADGVKRWGELAAKAKVEVELENHPLYDDVWERVARLKAAGPGDPNPFVVGTDGYQRFVRVMDECLLATVARKGG